MLVLDTDLLTIVQRREGAAYARLNARLEAAADEGEKVRLTVVTLEEQMRGWLAYVRKAKDVKGLIQAYSKLGGMWDDLRDMRFLPFDEPAAECYRSLQKLKLRIGTMDLRIAAIVLANDATLISRNTKDFERIPDLRVEDWTI